MSSTSPSPPGTGSHAKADGSDRAFASIHDLRRSDCEPSASDLHIDITEVRLTTGVRAYVQAVIDSFSRKILAHAVSDTKTAEESSQLVREACASLGVGSEPLIIADDGGENRADNPSVASALVDTGSTMAVAGVDLLGVLLTPSQRRLPLRRAR